MKNNSSLLHSTIVKIFDCKKALKKVCYGMIFCCLMMPLMGSYSALVPSLLIDTSVSNSTPGALETFCYRVRYRCASVTEHCTDSYIEMVLPTGMQIASLPQALGNISSVMTDSVTGGELITIELASPASAGLASNELAAGSSGILQICASWPCVDQGATQDPASGTNINITGPTFYANGISVTSNAPAPVTVPNFVQCPVLPSGGGNNGFIKEYNGYGPNINPSGLVNMYIVVPADTSSLVIIDSLPNGMLLSDFSVENGWTMEVSCGSNWFELSGYTQLNTWIWDNANAGHLNNLLIDPSAPPLPANQTGCSADTLGAAVIYGNGYTTDLTAFRVTTPVGGVATERTIGLTVSAADWVAPGNTTLLNCVSSSDTTMGVYCMNDALNVVAEPLLSHRQTAASCLGSTTIPNDWPLNSLPNFSDLTKDADDILWQLEMTIPLTSGLDLTGFALTDTLPLGLTFDPANGNWWTMAIGGAYDIFEPYDFHDQPDCHNPIFTKTFASDGREILHWDFQTCSLYHGLPYTRTMNLYLTTRFDKSIILPPSFVVKSDFHFSDGRLFNCVDWSGGISKGYNCRSSAVCDNTNIVGGGINSSKWVTGLFDNGQNRFPNIGSTDTSGYGTYEIYIDATDLRGIERLEIVDILPHIGDSTLTPRLSRDSEWSLEIAGPLSFEKFDLTTQTWVDASGDIISELYGNTYNPCYMDAFGQVRAATGLTEPLSVSCSSTDFSAANPAIGSKSFALVWENTIDNLAFGEQLRISFAVQQLAGEADVDNGSVAWNSVGVTASDGDGFELLSSEPLKVGLYMLTPEDVALGNLIWYDSNGNGIQDLGEAPIANVSVALCDAAGIPILAGGVPVTSVTNVDGEYYFPALEPNTTYTIKLDNPADFTTSGPLTNHSLTLANIGIDDELDSDGIIGAGSFPEITVTTGPAGAFDASNDFGFYIPNVICGLAWVDTDGLGDQNIAEPKYGNVSVDLIDSDGNVVMSTMTDSYGDYTFEEVPPGTYALQMTDTGSNGYVVTAQNQGTSDVDDSDANAAGLISPIIVSTGETSCNHDIGYTAPPTDPASIAGTVWDDLNNDGLFDVAEFPIQGIQLNLLDNLGFVIASTYTDINGEYLFSNLLPNNTYTVNIAPAITIPITLQDQGVDDTIDSDFDVNTGISQTLTPIENENIINVDGGLIMPYAIGNYVFNDVNENGIADSGEGAFPNLKMWLIDANTGLYLDSTFTDANGKYIFENLIPGSYKIVSQVPTGYTSSSDIGTTSLPNDADNDDNGTGVANVGVVSSNILTIIAGGGSPGDANWTETDHGDPINGIIYNISNPRAYYTVDFGFYEKGYLAVGNYVWLDEDGDGDQDAGEIGIGGVTVYLENASGARLDTVITDFNGGYLFENLLDGSYNIIVDDQTLPTGLQNQTYDLDGNLDHASTPMLNGSNDLTHDFGYNFAPPADTNAPANSLGAIGDRIWSDANGNGFEDSNEVGISGVTVQLLNATGTAIGTTTSDEAGYYVFDDLPAGVYSIEVDASTIPAGFVTTPTGDPDGDFTNDSENILLGPGDVFLHMDFGYNNPSSYEVGDQLFLDLNVNGIEDVGELPIPNVTVAIIADANANGIWDIGEMPIANATTDANGNYLFTGLQNGNYVIAVTDTYHVLSELSNTADPDGGANEYAGVTISNANDLLQDFGYAPTGHQSTEGLIGDLVFLDVDNNNAYTTGEPGIENVKVELFDSNNTLKASTYTDQNGYYLFGNLEADTYTIKIDPLTLPGAASIPAGLTPSADPDGGNDHQSLVTLTTGSQNLDQDFGYQAITPNTISGTIWEDSDANGTLDEATPNFFENVTIILRDDLGNLVGITSTDWNGDYAFTGLPDGTYTLDVLDENNIVGDYWKSAGVVIGANNNSQPDVYSVSVAGGSTDDTADFGYYTFGAAIGNYVWEDVNEDGIQDGSEVGIPDVIVSLEVSFPGGVVVTLTDTTDATGYYSFENLLLDEDYVSGGGGVMPSFTLSAATPIGFQTTIIDANSNANDGADSEDPAGTSAVPVKGLADISPTSTQAIAFYDFGFSQIPLPVTLISFEVSANECNAELSWRSEVETDFSHYIVERSTNGSLTFEYLTKVEAKQNAGIKSYNFEDIYITGKAFYRLKMLNLDGTYSYSNIVAVETDCENEVSGIQLYPNPVASSFSTINMKLLSKSESVAWMVVTDNLGKELLKFPANLMEGENIMGIDISNLSPGSYFISVKLDSGKTRTKQFVKIAE